MNFNFKSRSGCPRPFNAEALLCVLCVSSVGAMAGCSAEARSSSTTAAVAAPVDGSDAQRLVALVDYIGGDYKRAVEDGRVLSDFEYQEQLRFAADARIMAEGLVGTDRSADDTLLRRLADVETRVGAKADAADVTAACRAAREEAVVRFGLKTMPSERPELQRAQFLYADACATCHGAKGDGDTERAKTLDPSPARFKDPTRLGDLSPYRVYNALTFGVPGTAMAAFDALSPRDRWSLAFYVFRLGHDGDATRGPVAMTLADMAMRTDREVKEALQAEGHPAPDEGTAFARLEVAFAEPPAGLGIDRTRSHLRRALAAYGAGRPRDADRLVLDAYLQGFEPLEPRLRARDAAGTREVEAGFRDLRAAIAGAEPEGRVRARGQALDRRIAALGEGGRRPLVPFAAGFLIYFREGIEAAILVGALLAGLRRLGRSDARGYIHGGWLLALPAGALTYWLLARAITLGADQREMIEATVALLAAAVLFSVSFWMISKAESRHWMAYLKGRLEEGINRKSLLVLSGLAFLAVYREAAETILFTQALLLESGAHGRQVWLGAGAGLLAVVAVAYVMNRTVLRLPLGPFFAVSSVLLCAMAVSFAGSGFYELVAAGLLPPRPVAFPEIPWLGIHPDLTGLLVQLAIVLVIVGAGLLPRVRRPLTESPKAG
jgi:high-affinity iron transporter